MFNDRLLRVGIEIDGQLNWYENLAITATGQKTSSITQNNTEITIANLPKNIRDFLLTEGTPFRRVERFGTENRLRVIVQAGRESYGYSTVYEGEITTTSITQPPDLIITVNALTGHNGKSQIVNTQLPPVSRISEIAQSVADSLGVGLEFSATDKSISNYGYDGAADGQLAEINSLGVLDVFVDDNTLVVKDRNVPRGSIRRVLNPSDIIGKVEFIEFGVRVKFLFDPETQIGAEIEINSRENPAANGVYVIFRLSFDLANRENPFYLIAEARPIGR